MNVFLTGGTGFIGGPLTRALLSRGWSVTALARKPETPEARALSRIGARCVAGDVTDRESMRASMTGADIVVHAAGVYEIGVDAGARARMRTINVTGTDNVLGLALELRVPRTVYVSSALVLGDTGARVRDETFVRQAGYGSFYEETKTEAHQLALQYVQRGLPLVITCPASVVGANDHSVWGYLLRLYLNGLMAPFGWTPDMINSSVHVDDVSAGIALAAEKGRLGESYLLAGDPTTLREVFGAWMTRPGGMAIRFYVPQWLAAALLAPIGPVLRWAGLPAFLSHETVTASVSLDLSSAKAARELGWTHRATREMWPAIVDEEVALLAARTKRDIVSRLNPVVPAA